MENLLTEIEIVFENLDAVKVPANFDYAAKIFLTLNGRAAGDFAAGVINGKPLY